MVALKGEFQIIKKLNNNKKKNIVAKSRGSNATASKIASVDIPYVVGQFLE